RPVPAWVGPRGEFKDQEARGHNQRVANLAVEIGRELGLGEADLQVLERAGLLHDLGKPAIPGANLQKHDPLDDSEWRLMKTHPELGLTILEWAGHLERGVVAVVYHHATHD